MVGSPRSGFALPRRHKAYKPRQGAYVEYDKIQEIIKKEDPFWSLLIEVVFTFGLRIHEAIGKPPYKDKPGLRPCDIDSVKSAAIGLEAAHNLRIYRKRGKFTVLPMEQEIYTKIQAHIKKEKIGMNDRIFPRYRTTCYQHLSRHGFCVNDKYPIGCHALRRSMGVDYLNNGGDVQDLQQIYDHEKLGQTFEYVGGNRKRAFNNLSKFHRERSNGGGVA